MHPLFTPKPLHLSPNGSGKCKPSKPAELLVNGLKEGFQLLGNGKETVFVNMRRVHIPAKFHSQFSIDFRSKPKNVPAKYWSQRYAIFSKYDEGIQLDAESWFSVTHEAIAEDIAKQCSHFDIVMDGFAGAGGNVIQFAKFCHTLAVELEADKLEMLQNNARIYGVDNRIEYLHGDFLEVAASQGPEVIFMSPPWGGPNYKNTKKFDLFKGIRPDINEIMKVCGVATRNVILYLPRTVNPAQVIQLFRAMPNFERKLEFQLYCFGNKVKTVGCFFGDFVKIDSAEAAAAVFARMKIPRPFPPDLDQACKMFVELAEGSGLSHALQVLYSKKKKKKPKKAKKVPDSS